MTRLEDSVAAHYRTGSVMARITGALAAAGLDLHALRPADLKPFDELHAGGLEATEALLARLSIEPDTVVLDIGSGIGGATRLVAERYGARAIGVDLTGEFVAVAQALTEMVGLDGRAEFMQASALDLPLADGSVDLALMLHVGMNISDKAALFAEVARVLRPRGTFAVYDVMGGAVGVSLTYPLPWATTPETSFVAPPWTYRKAAQAAGFEEIDEEDRRGFALDFFRKVSERVAREGPPLLGTNLVMGETWPVRIRNFVADVEAGRLTPMIMIFERA